MKDDAAYRSEVQEIAARRPKAPHPRKYSDQAWMALFAVLMEGKLSLKQATALPGMPSMQHFTCRRSREPAFAVLTAAFYEPLAKRRADRLRTYSWDVALERIRRGTPFSKIAGKGNFPGSDAWYTRRSTDVAFDAEVVAAMKAGCIGKNKIPLTTRQAVIHRLKAGESLTSIASAPDMPSYAGIYLLRKRDASFGQQVSAVWKRRSPPFSPASIDKALRALGNGCSPRQLGPDGLPGWEVLRRRRRKDPVFARRLAGALALGGLGNVGADAGGLRSSLHQNAVWAAVNTAVPRGLPSFVRDDVVSEMVADVLEGYLDVREVRGAAGGYVTAYHRETGTWAARSFDAELGADGGRTLHDVVAG